MDIIKLTPKFTPEAVLLTGDNLKEVADSEWSNGKVIGMPNFVSVFDETWPQPVVATPGQYIIKTGLQSFSVHEPESLNYFYKGTTL